VPWWGFIIVIVVVAAVTCGMWWAVLSSRGDAAQTQGPTPTPIFVVITSTPTLGAEEGAASGTEAAPATATPTSLPVATETPDVAANPVQVGSTIEINGTDGSGLAVRQGPGVNYTYFFVANDGDVFLVEDGPRDADGYTWWYISDPNNADRTGWAVEDWMTVTTP